MSVLSSQVLSIVALLSLLLQVVSVPKKCPPLTSVCAAGDWAAAAGSGRVGCECSQEL